MNLGEIKSGFTDKMSVDTAVMKLRKHGVKMMSEFEVKETKFLWYPYIPMDKVTIIQGDPGGGKTTLILDLIAKVSKAKPELGGHKLDTSNKTSIYLTAEDGYGDTVVPRLIQSDADLKEILAVQNSTDLWMLLGSVLEVIDIAKPAILVLDPLQAFFGNGDMNRANDVREIMSTLGQIAEEFHLAIVLIGHLNKKSGDNELYRGLGSIDFIAAARSVLQVTQNKTGQRVIKHIKSSLAPKGEDLEIVLKDGVQIIPYEPLAVEGKRETQLSKVPEATRALCANMKDEWWTKNQITQWLRENWQITNTNLIAQITNDMIWKQDGRKHLYHAPIEKAPS